MPMLRPALLLLLPLALLAVSTPSGAAEPVFLRGYEVTPQHVVFGRIDALAGNVADVNLGYAHGMRAGEALLVVRLVDGEVIPIAGLTVKRTEADHCVADVAGPFRVAVGDYVMIRASHLKLWGGMSRPERLAREVIVRRKNATGYNTLDTSPELVDEVARDDDFRGRQYTGVKTETMIQEAAQKAGPVKSEIGAVAPLPLLEVKPVLNLDAPAVKLDATIQSFSYFAELAKSRDLLIPRMSNERLQTLRPMLGQPEVNDDTAPLYRDTLLTWTRKAIVDE